MTAPAAKSSGLKKWLKRLALAALLLTVGVAAVVGTLAWRATRVPTWYATALSQSPPSDVADTAWKSRLVPLLNWLARTSTGDLAARPDAEKIYTLELADTDINALIAMGFDNQHGEADMFRVRLVEDEIDLAFNATAYNRTVSLTTAVGQTADGRPTVSLGGLRLGDQTAPAWLVSRFAAPYLQQARQALEEKRQRGRPPRIDERDAAPGHTAEMVYGRLLLEIASGRTVASPFALLPASREGDTFVATRVTALDVSDGKLAVTFRMLTPEERTALLAELAGPLPGS